VCYGDSDVQVKCWYGVGISTSRVINTFSLCLFLLQYRLAQCTKKHVKCKKVNVPVVYIKIAFARINSLTETDG